MLYKFYTNDIQVLYNAIKTSISIQCHSVKRLSRLPCAVCTLERRCQLTSKGDHGGMHASREVMRTHGGMASLAFREASRARLAWRDRHPCVRTAFHGVITTALTLFPLYTLRLHGTVGRRSGARHWHKYCHWDGHWTRDLEHALALGRALALAVVPHAVCGSTAIPATVTVERATSSS